KEEGHMGIFLRLGNAKLFLTCISNDFSEGSVDILLGEDDVKSAELIVIRGHGEIVQGNGLHPGLRHVLLRKHYCQLSGPVIPEIDEDNHIAFCDSCQGMSVS